MLNVNAVLDPVTGGGTAERTVQISRFLIEEGIDCSIMTTDLGFTDGNLSGADDIQVIAYRCIVNRFYIPLVRYSEIKNIIRNFDIIHVMGHWTILNVLVYFAARSLGKPYVVCPAGALPIFGRSRILKKIYNLLFGANIIKNASAWISITEDEKYQFIPYGINIDDITVIPNGVDFNDFPGGGETEFRAIHGINDNPFMLFLGRLNLIKGPDILLDAFIKGVNDWPDWHLVFAGPDGGLLAQLEKTVSNTDTIKNRVHFIGYVGGTEKSAAYHAADLLVIPSRQEAMSIVVLESGISSTPVVLTDQCGFDQVEKIGGGKISPATVEGVFASLKDTLKDSADLADMGKKLQSYVRDNYTWTVVIRKYVQLYERLLSK